MSYIQAKTNNYFGFAPAMLGDQLERVTPYLVSSSEGAINAGDLCVLTTLATVRAATGAFASTMIGVAAHFMAANGGSTGATINSNSSQMLLLYDDPDQLFVACVTTSFLMGSTSVGKNVAVLTTGAVGSTGANSTLLRSVMALSGNTASSAGTLKLVGLHPIENGDFSTDAGGAGVAGSVRKWIVRPNIHFLAAGAAGTLITS